MGSTQSLEVAGVVDSPQSASALILSRVLLPPEMTAVAAAAEVDTDAAATVVGGATVLAVEVIEAEVRAAV